MTRWTGQKSCQSLKNKIFFLFLNSLISVFFNLTWTFRICKCFLDETSCSVSNTSSRSVLDVVCIETGTVLRHCNLRDCKFLQCILRCGSLSCQFDRLDNLSNDRESHFLEFVKYWLDIRTSPESLCIVARLEYFVCAVFFFKYRDHINARLCVSTLSRSLFFALSISSSDILRTIDFWGVVVICNVIVSISISRSSSIRS